MAIGSILQIHPFDFKPSAPPSGQYIIYAKTDNTIYIQDSLGNEFAFGSTTGISALTGEATGVGPGAATVTLSNSAVIGKVLTGFTSGPNSAVLATDTILQAIQKLQAQASAGAASAITALTGDVTASGPGSVPATVVSVGGKSASNIASAVDDVQAATASNTASTIVERDASGNFSANVITANLNGNANTATSAGSFSGSLTGDVTGTQGATVVASVGGKSAAAVASSVDDTQNATSINTISTIVERDASGNFAANNISANLTGVASGNELPIVPTTSADYYRGDKTFQPLNKAAVGLSNVDNTSDANKPVSVAQAAAINAKVSDAIVDGVTTIAPSQNAVFDSLALKQNTVTVTDTNTVDLTLTGSDIKADVRLSDATIVSDVAGIKVGIVPAAQVLGLAAVATSGNKADVGLGNVDNTSDVNKPVSTAQAAAIAVVQADIDTHQADLANPHATTKAQVGLGNADNTSDMNKPVSAAQSAADAAVQAFSIQRANHTGTQLSSTISDFTEAAQDAVGGSLVDTATIDFTYNDALNQISADVRLSNATIVSDAGGIKVGTLPAAQVSGLAAVATSGLASDVGLGNVDNTSDLDKPISSATQAALDFKMRYLPSADSHQVWVSATAGNDGTGDGSLGNPFQTITAATTFAESMSPGPYNTWVINVLAGVYTEPGNLIIPAWTWIKGQGRDAVRVSASSLELAPSWSGSYIYSGISGFSFDNNLQVNFNTAGVGSGTNKLSFGDIFCTQGFVVSGRSSCEDTIYMDNLYIRKQTSILDIKFSETFNCQLRDSVTIEGANRDSVGVINSCTITGNLSIIDSKRFPTRRTVINCLLESFLVLSGSLSVALIDSTSLPSISRVTLSGGTIERISDVYSLNYSPSTPSDWTVVPTLAQEALDTLAAQFGAVSPSSHGSRHSPTGLDPVPTGPASTQVPDQANATGTSGNLARADHVHNIPAAIVVNIGTSNFKGAAASFALSDHVHAHGNQTNGSLHAIVTNSTNGFMSAADKIKLDAATALATPSTIVFRDASGNFSANSITSNLVGNVTGNLTGNVTGNASGTSANVTGIVTIANGGTNASTVPSARVNLNIDKRNTFSNVNYLVLNTDSFVAQVGTLSAIRTVTLPLANTVNAGYEIIIADESGSCNLTNYITVVSSGADLINGLSSENIQAPYGFRRLISNGVNGYVFDGGVLRSSKNLSDLQSVPTARANLGLTSSATTVNSSANTPSTIVSRDASGNFAANVITANLTGNVTGAASLNLLKSGDSMTGFFRSAIVGLTDAASIATNVALGNTFTVTLGGNRTLANPTGMGSSRQKATWSITQDATGGRTLAFDTAFNFGIDMAGLSLSTSPNATDYIGAIYNPVTARWDILAITRGY